MKRMLLGAALAALVLGGSAVMAAQNNANLRIYWIDVEGGASTLFVSPTGESLLFDTGNPGNGDRDAKRIFATAKKAGLTRIDHFITTHWHIDHIGGLPELAKRIPIERFYDRGLPPSPKDEGTKQEYVDAYLAISKGREKVLKSGDEVPLRELPGSPKVTLKCVVANSMPEGGAASVAGAAACTVHPAHAADLSDNAKSLGFVLTFGGFRFLVLGDLTWNVEHALVCPKNRLGDIDLYQVTHHGLDLSNNPVLLEAIKPRAAVMENGPRKGGARSVIASLKSLGTELFQVHRNVDIPESANAPRDHVANWDDPCQGEPVTARVSPDAKSYTVKVGRGGIERTFETRAR